MLLADSEPVVWSHPLPPGETRERWMQCVLDVVETEKRDGRNHVTSHWIFAKQVLRETKTDRFQIAGRFRYTPLTREAMERIADDWWEPTKP